MYLEERVAALETENRMLQERLEQIEQYSTTRFVSISELAVLMGCTPQNIYKKIKAGQIKVTRKLGDPRIPMSQFLEDLEGGNIIKPKKEPAENSMARQIFGD